MGASAVVAMAAIAVLVLGTGRAWGQFSVNSPPSPVGSGARALGMGGAFVAIADDATAASWNPGGLTQLERPELSFVYSWRVAREDFATTPFIIPRDDTYSLTLDNVNFFSFVYPIPRTFGGRNLVLSVSYQQKLDFDRTLDFVARQTVGSFSPAFGGIYTVTDRKVDLKYRQEGGLATLSPAIGFEITNRLSVGVAANIWDSDLVGSNEWETKRRWSDRIELRSTLATLNIPPKYSVSEIDEEFSDYKATNYTIGMLFKPNDRWGIGLVYHTKYTATVEHETRTRNLYVQGTFPAPTTVMREKLKFNWPAATALGVSYRFPNDKLTLALDVTYRDWDNYTTIETDAPPGTPERSPLTDLPKSESPHDPTWTVRLGGEYVFVRPKKPKQGYLPSIRAGLFYDPEPASGRKDGFWGPVKGDGDPDDYYGFALGLGLLVKNRVNIDVAYQYRWGNDVRRDTFAGSIFEIQFDEDVQSHTFFLSTVIYF